jgi:hypothetical protein
MMAPFTLNDERPAAPSTASGSALRASDGTPEAATAE